PNLIFGYRAGGQQVGSHIKKVEAEYAWGEVISALRNDSRNILIASYSMGDVADRVADIYKLDVFTGLKTKVTRAPIPGAKFGSDENGELRIAMARDRKSVV